jgi:hypothetical protein
MRGQGERFARILEGSQKTPTKRSLSFPSTSVSEESAEKPERGMKRVLDVDEPEVPAVPPAGVAAPSQSQVEPQATRPKKKFRGSKGAYVPEKNMKLTDFFKSKH